MWGSLSSTGQLHPRHRKGCPGEITIAEEQWRTVWSRAILPTWGLCSLLQNKSFLSGIYCQQWGRVSPGFKQWPSPTCPVYRVEALFVASRPWATLNLHHKTHRVIVRMSRPPWRSAVYWTMSRQSLSHILWIQPPWWRSPMAGRGGRWGHSRWHIHLL